jgi:hypothetical protein
VSDLLLNGLAPTQTQLNGGVGTVTEGQDTVTQITGESSTTMNGTIPFDFGVMTGLSPGQQGGNTTSVSFTLSQPGGFTAQDFQNFLDTTAEYGFRLINVDIVNGNSLKVFGEPNPQLLPLEPFPEAFGYTEGAAVASAVDLGNKINNDIDPNAGGVISFSQLDTAVFEVPATPFLQSYVAGLTVVVSGPNTITITDSASHAATITVDALGEELISDPFNIFKPLNLGESIVLDVGYHIQDNLGLSAADSQTITISGTNQALVPTPEAFSYMEGAGSADLGNKISNDVDPNHDGVISFATLDTAHFETPSSSWLQTFVAGLTVTIQNHNPDGTPLVGDGNSNIVVTDTFGHKAYINISSSGEEFIVDPNNIFKPLETGDSLVLDVGYTIKDNLGLTALDSQTITIHGVTQGHPFTSDLSNLVLYLQNSAGAVEKVIFQNGAQLAFRTDSDIITWMDDHSSLLNGYTMLDAFTYHVGPNNELNKTLAADMRPNEGQLVLTPHGDINQITDTHYYSPSNFPGDTKQKLIIDLQNHSVDTLAQLVGTPLANGAHLHDGYALTINNSTII